MNPASMRRVTTLFFLFALSTLPTSGQMAGSGDAGCALQNGAYQCNWSSFQLTFERAHAVAVEGPPRDRPVRNQLSAMVRELGKADVAQGETADLTVVLMPVEPTGINLGPGDHELATLRVYAPGMNSGHGGLLWAEVLRGQGDRPWPAQVHALITQFQERFGTK